MTEEFLKRNPIISRTIEIRGDQTLEQLHQAIFVVFDREEEHMYEFRFGEGPQDPDAPRYVLPFALDDPDDEDDRAAGVVTGTTIDSLGLTVGRAFGYWFDFGDNWYHQIDVMAVGGATPKVGYPRMVARVGESPPQYADFEDEDEE